MTTIDTAVDARCAALEAANSRRMARTALDRFAAFLRENRDTQRLDAVDPTDCRRWAQALREEARAGDLAASTANQYYANVRAAFSWWVRDGRIATNPAKRERAVEELPEDTRDPDRQFWSPEQRDALLDHVDRAADAALDAAADRDEGPAVRDDVDVLLAFRDRALAYVVGTTGVRGGEVLRDPADDERDGLRWADVGDATLRVFRKTRTYEPAVLPAPAGKRLARWRDVLDPASDDWPVFPTLSKGTLRRALDDAGLGGNLPSEASVRARLDAFADAGAAPPAISTAAGRAVVKRLGEAAPGIDDDADALQPHGARRGLGDEVFREKGATAARDVLGHEDVGTTQAFYEERQVERRAEDVEDVLGR